MSFSASETQAMDPGDADGAVTGLRIRGSDTVFPLPVDQRRWVIGTGAGCDIVLPDRYVSGTHCVLERRVGDGVVVVRDRKSRNGTRVDGNAIEGAELRPGSTLELGRTALIAVATAAARPRRAVEALRGQDPVLGRAIAQAVRAATTECSVLIVGETGTGKELLARIIHEGSPRRAGPMVAVNCGAIPRDLIAAELFGHERGAFTGAHGERDGYFVQAHGGTLFLDELAELPLALQPNLLRVLETRRVRRLGANQDRSVDVRIVAATNRLDVGHEAAALRLDLYHRVATVVLRLPPLRDRMGDLPELVGAMLDELAPECGNRVLTPEAWDALAAYDWPGNVRELRQAVQRAVALGERALVPGDFFPELVGARRDPIPARPLPTPPFGLRRAELPRAEVRSLDALTAATAGLADGLRPYQALQRDLMAEALERHGSIRAAASALGMPKSTFADRCKQWGLLKATPTAR